MATPTLINLPEQASNPETPTEMPGTPNSTTTSLSALSTTAIKDGHRGAPLPHTSSGHHHTASSNTLEAERADRISRLAGLERVSAVRGAGHSPYLPQTYTPSGGPGYFDATKMSTVGSASATGSVAGRTTTWASGSARGQDDEDMMSMDTNYPTELDDRDRFSASAMMDEDRDMDEGGDGMSDEVSLVGFGEGAGSTVSGPIYSRRDLVGGAGVLGNGGRASPAPAPFRSSYMGMHSPSEVSNTPSESTIEQQKRSARMVDGLADDVPAAGYIDTAARGGPVPVDANSRSRMSGVEVTDRIMRDRLNQREDAEKTMATPEGKSLGKFYFEDKR
ncbi:hypothetical protein B7463_g7934, partial [Scytalidium lignicola]